MDNSIVFLSVWAASKYLHFRLNNCSYCAKLALMMKNSSMLFLLTQSFCQSNLYIHPIPQEIKMAHTKCTNTRNTLFQ